ncbi:MAG TPA: gliding motility protein GldL [Bacteroidia bacterium]|jgi:gliding motility-associated protein GldL|nr:gliding motility protein GldL [Bacteroidia bacterium]
MGLLAWLESKSGKVFLHKTYSFGASVVIVGALFKIQHYPGANAILPFGLGTEAVIFILFGLQKPHEEVDWSLVYPELSGMHGEEVEGKDEKKGSITEQLDDMLEEAKIGPELMESLERGMRSLSENAAKMSNIAEASVATGEYTANITSASKNIGDLAKNSSKAAESLEGMVGTDVGGATKDYINNVKSVTESMGDLSSNSTKASELLRELSNSNSSNYVQQIDKMSENAASLNAVYEMQLQASHNQVNAAGQLFESMSKLVENVGESVEDTRRYKQEMAQLTQHLESLNTVYGNMLTAMNVRK